MRLLSLLALCLTLTGCSRMMHEMQPHRLWRWNYQESSGRTDGSLFSVDDPLVQTAPAAVEPVRAHE